MSKLKIYACSGLDTCEVSRVAQKITSSGWERNETLRKYLGSSNDGGGAEYFLYTFIPESELGKYNAVIWKKREQQLKTFEYIREIFVGYNYGTEEDMIQIIRDGIEDTFGMSVEHVLAGIRGEKVNGVGSISVGLAMIIVAIITLVTTVITGVIQYCQSVKVAQYTAPTYQEIEDSTPDSTDFLDTSKKKGKMLALVAGAGVLLFGLLKK